MRRRIYGLLAAVCLILAVMPAVRAADDIIDYPVTGGNIKFDKSSGTVTSCESLVTKADIPNEIETVRVTSIGDSAFFGCKSLTSVSIPDSVTSIGNSAFLGCTSLTSINIPDGVTFIGDSAFRGCKMTSISIPGSVTSIGTSAFLGCTSLTRVNIPGSVTVIRDKAFERCSGLTNVYYDGTRAEYETKLRPNYR